MSAAAPVKWSLEDLSTQIVAASLHDTGVLEHVSARYKSRLEGTPLGSLFSAASQYFDVTRSLLTRSALQSLLVNNVREMEKIDEYLALYDSLTAPPYADYTEADRRWFLHQYDTEWQIAFTGNAMATAATKMREEGNPDAAWSVLSESRVEFTNMLSGGALSEADLTEITDKLKLHYHEVVENKYPGVQLCLPEVNERLGGLRPGDMHIVTGFAHEGKSFVKMNDGHHAWVHGMNIGYANGEMGGFKFPNRFVALHSTYLHGLGKTQLPLETRKIDRGLLSPEEHETFLQVLEDMRSRGNGQYGRFFHFTFGFNTTPSAIFNKFAGYDAIAPLDLAVIDYLGLLTSQHRRITNRERLDDVIRETKQLALDFRKGAGIPLVAGYQVNRQSYEKALAEGHYTLSCFAESSEAEKSADSAMWILGERQNPQELKCGFIKNRDDELGEPFHILRNFKAGQIASLQSSRARSQVAGAGANLLDV